MKSPKEIAEMAAQNLVARHMIGREEGERGISAFAWALGDPLDFENGLREFAAEVIELDRAQRDPNEGGTLHGAAIIALKDREFHGAERAAEWIENNHDDFWDRYAGPMLDEIEQERAWE